MICPECGHQQTYTYGRQEGREAVITHEEAIEAYGLIADGLHTEGAVLMRRLLARTPVNDEREAT